jgi:hypothetical protein
MDDDRDGDPLEFFFIAGLPRSRTAWLANWFTSDSSICLHDAWRYVKNAKELRNLLERIAKVNPHCKYIGTSDSCNGWFIHELREEFQEARFGRVNRDVNDARNATKYWLNKVGLAQPLEGLFTRLNLLDGMHQEHLPSHNLGECGIEADPGCDHDVIGYHLLDFAPALRRFQKHLMPESIFSLARFTLLDGLQIEVHTEKYLSSFSKTPQVGNACVPSGLLL